MKKAKKKFNKKKFLNILSYIGVSVFFLFALICAIAKFNGAKFVFFGRRYDVVLTNSMSEKNEKYKEFLEGHDDQFDAFDLAVSKKVKSPEDLHVYDVVIYNDRDIGTNMHRIVSIEEEGHDEIKYKTAQKTELSGQSGICLTSLGSKVEFSDIPFKDVELKAYTEIPIQEQHYNFSIVNKTLTPEISYESSGNGMIVTYKVHKDDLGLGTLSIAHSKTFDYSKEIIISLKVNATTGEINSDATNVETSESDLLGIYNTTYRYETRGDKASTSDGFYSFNEIEAKVVKNIRNGGYLVRFLNSIWGGIMFISLGFLIVGMQMWRNHLEKKETAGASTAKVKVEKQEVKKSEPTKKEPAKKEETSKAPESKVLKDKNGRFVSKKSVSATKESPKKEESKSPAKVEQKKETTTRDKSGRFVKGNNANSTKQIGKKSKEDVK